MERLNPNVFEVTIRRLRTTTDKTAQRVTYKNYAGLFSWC